jgi:hypothetical protein
MLYPQKVQRSYSAETARGHKWQEALQLPHHLISALDGIQVRWLRARGEAIGNGLAAN